MGEVTFIGGRMGRIQSMFSSKTILLVMVIFAHFILLLFYKTMTISSWKITTADISIGYQI